MVAVGAGTLVGLALALAVALGLPGGAAHGGVVSVVGEESVVNVGGDGIVVLAGPVDAVLAGLELDAEVGDVDAEVLDVVVVGLGGGAVGILVGLHGDGLAGGVVAAQLEVDGRSAVVVAVGGRAGGVGQLVGDVVVLALEVVVHVLLLGVAPNEVADGGVVGTELGPGAVVVSAAVHGKYNHLLSVAVVDKIGGGGENNYEI